MAFQDALDREPADGFLDGVRIDRQLAANGADGGHLLAGVELAGGNRLLHRSYDLLVDRLAQLEVDKERQHATVLVVVIQMVQSNDYLTFFLKYLET